MSLPPIIEPIINAIFNIFSSKKSKKIKQLEEKIKQLETASHPTAKEFELLKKYDVENTRIQKIIDEITGDWKYSCLLIGSFQFLEGGNAHGGFCTITGRRTLMAIQIMVNGRRTWYDHIVQGVSTDYHDLIPNKRWNSIEGEAAFISDSKLIYKYKIDDGAIEGISTLEIKYVNGEIVLEGIFNYLPDEKQLNKGEKNFDKMMEMKPDLVGNFPKMLGYITLKRVIY